jgi:hypothetical protein
MPVIALRPVEDVTQPPAHTSAPHAHREPGPVTNGHGSAATAATDHLTHKHINENLLSLSTIQ